MSYDTLLENEIKEAQYLAVIKHRTRLTSFTLFSGSVYSTSFTLTQYVVRIKVNGVELTRNTTTALSAGQFYFDNENQILYLRLSDSSDPNSTSKFVIVTYELYFGTFDAHFFRDPLDDSTTEVYFEPTIDDSPDIKGQVSDLLFGFLPVQSASITLSNSEHLLEPIIYSGSFNGAEISLYHWLSENGELKVENIKKVMNGLCSKVTYDEKTVQIEIRDRVDLLSKEWRNEGENFYSTTLFPNLNPTFIGKPIRYIYGKVQGVIPVNVDYQPDSPTTSDNREHAVMSEVNDLAERVYTVPASPSSTTTRTYLNTAQGLWIGDTVFLDGATDYYVEITAINYGANPYIEHAAIGAPMATGEFAKKGFVSRIDIIQNGQRFLAMYGRDYTCTDNLLSANVAGFTFSTSLESNLSMPDTFSPTDTVYCTVYGRQNNVTLGGPSFGSDDSQLGVLTDPVVILWQILKTKIGLTESDLNGSSFTDLLSLIGGQSIGLAIPEDSNKSFPSIKDIIIKICKTIIVSLYIDNDLKWKVSRQGPIASIDFEMPKEEIVLNAFKAAFDYDDVLSDVIVEYNAKEAGETFNAESLTDKVTATSDTASYLHEVQKQGTFQSLHIKESEAQGLCDNLALIFGDRNSEYNLTAVSKFFGILINDKVRVSSDKLPGFTFEEGVENSRDLVVTSIQKTLSKVSLKLTDQKGIEENSGSWVE